MGSVVGRDGRPGRLRRNGLVTRRREGRSYRHLPTHSREELSADAMMDALRDSSDRALTLAWFVQAAADDDMETLRGLLRTPCATDSAGPRGQVLPP